MRACAGAMSLSCVCACHRSLTRPCASRLLQGPAVCLSLLSRVDSPMEAVSLLVVSQSCDAFSQSGLYSNHQDIAPRYAGVLLGMSNTAGVLAGVLGTYAVGVILEDGSWDEVFSIAVGLYLFGTVVWNCFSTGEQLFDEDDEGDDTPALH